ncbi:MAG: methylmalonyl-CoA carboxyltransferase [Candidatus Dormibacteraeota bacterium]|nr:methylmalonyl-CoA carboxyltransferase [Candidatus Dormibacteraeota bacterium]
MAKRVDSDGGGATTEVRTSTGREKKLDQLRQRRQEVLEGGPEAGAGGPAVRARLAALLDEGSFVELDMFATSRAGDFGMDEVRVAGDGAIAGFGTIDGREVAVYAIDVSVLDGAIGEVTAEKIAKLQDLALRSRIPLVAIDDAAGPRFAEGLPALAGRTKLLAQKARASGVIPQLSVRTASSSSTADATPAALADLTFQVGGDPGGGPHFRFPDEAACWGGVRQVLAYLPSNSAESPPSVPPADGAERSQLELQELIPEGAGAAYDVRDVIGRVLDAGTFLEARAAEAENVVVGLGRLGGHPVGVVANQPLVRDGALDGPAALKAGRFVRTCDAFNLPVVAFVDSPEPAGDASGAPELAALPAAYGEATVPKLTVVLRRWYGEAYSLFGAKELGADLNLAWPFAEIAVAAPEAAIDVLYRTELSEGGGERRASFAGEYRASVASPYVIAERGHIDDVIEPRETRRELVRGLELCRRKQVELPARKHGSLPV